VFGIEIEQCARCGGRLKVIASIGEPEVIERIVTPAGAGRGGGAEGRARGARATAGVVAVILIVEGLVFFGASAGRCCVRCGGWSPRGEPIR
jgi:hypothetical protein